MKSLVLRTFLILATAAVLCLGPATAQERQAQEEALAEASEHGEEHAAEHFNVDLWKWANFAILAGIVGWAALKYGGAFFASRSQQIRRELDEAAEQRRIAEERYAAVEAKLANLDAEIQNLRTASRVELQAELARLSEETDRQMSKIERQTQGQIDSALRNAQAELREYTSKLSVELAEQRVRQQWTPDAEQRLIDQFLDRLEQDMNRQPSS